MWEKGIEKLGSGDRFGHATVLGLDLEAWYHRKDYCIHLKEQDYLDHVMWFYMMIMGFHIEGCELLKDYLYKEFLEAFHHIYVENHKRTEISDTEEQINIFQYFDSWKLRGNPPENYKKETEDDIKSENPQITKLYYRYYFEKREKSWEIADHPVLNLYSIGLGDKRDIPQMFVSINTDDRGVFQTSLKNEYALLAASVENLTDENGKNCTLLKRCMNG